MVSAWVEDLEKTRDEIDRLLSAMKETGRKTRTAMIKQKEGGELDA